MEPKEPPSERNKAKNELVWTRIFYGRDVIRQILENIDTKRALRASFQLRYIFRAAMAGVICILFYLFAYQLKTELGLEATVGASKLAVGIAFSFALAFIYFTNSELLTSNFMYFTVGFYYKKINLKGTLAVLASCLFGNLLGIVFVAVLVYSSQMIDQQVVDNIVHTVEYKTVTSGPWQIFVWSIFANYFINISVITALVVKDSFSKIVVLCVGVIVFAYMGYEHVIANSALFSLAMLFEPESVSFWAINNNFWISMFGNYIGGGLIIGLFYAYLNDNRNFQKISE